MNAGNHRTWKTTRSSREAASEEYDAAYADAEAAEELAQMVYDRRIALGLTQTELADRAGMKQPAISRIESGGTTPTVPLLKRLARALDADLTVAFTPTAAEPAAETSDRRPYDTPSSPRIAASGQSAPDWASHLPVQGLLVTVDVGTPRVRASQKPEVTRPVPLPETWSTVAQFVRSFVIDEGQLRSSAESQHLAASLLVAALGHELGLSSENQLRRELPERVEQLLANRPTF